MAGYLHALGDLSQTYGCQDCLEKPPPTHMNPSGPDLSGFVRTTFGRRGRFALLIRTRWFLSGGLLHELGAAFEGGLP